MLAISDEYHEQPICNLVESNIVLELQQICASRNRDYSRPCLISRFPARSTPKTLLNRNLCCSVKACSGIQSERRVYWDCLHLIGTILIQREYLAYCGLRDEESVMVETLLKWQQ